MSKGPAVHGTILIVDGVATNRIMLRVQLSSAYYHVVQATGLDGIADLARRCHPDLIVTAMALPDGDALRLHARLQGDADLAQIPVIAVTAENDRRARIRALKAGIDDVISQPVDDVLLQARIRSVLRRRSGTEDLQLKGDAPTVLGLSEAGAVFAHPRTQPRIALVSDDPARSARWRDALLPSTGREITCHSLGDAQGLMTGPAPDAIVIHLPEGGAMTARGLRLLADLATRVPTRHAARIAVVQNAAPQLAAEALDRGAHDVIEGGFCADELALRLAAQLQQKEATDRLRDSVRDGLQAAVTDPMTGLFNRRYALPHLTRVARRSAQTGRSFAIMLADLDHFKSVNDRFGHQAGDAVLIETAARLRAGLRPDDMIARVGGEEFMIVLPETGRGEAIRIAKSLCRRIDQTAVQLPGKGGAVSVTISIGVVVGPDAKPQRPDRDELPASTLIGWADRALYVAKDAGRNQVTLFSSAA